jgi:PleD family two-component response regulator
VARALIIDGDPVSRDLLSDLCRSMRFEVETAADGIGALEILRSKRVHLILLDLTLPRRDGLGVLEALREEVPDPAPAVIIVTSQADATDRLRGAELGALDFVDKPFRVADLSRRIERALAVTELQSKLRREEQQLWTLRAVDSTTGMGHANQLFEVLDGEFAWAQSAGRPLSCAVVSDDCANSDNPKDHQERLQRLAAAVETGLAPTHRSFRVDVAELVVVLPGTSRSELDVLVADLLDTCVRQPGLEAADLAVGGASHPHPEITQAAHLYRAASVALARARTTKKQVALFNGFGVGTPRP